MKVTRSFVYQFIVFHVYILAYYLTFPYKDRWGSAALLFILAATLAFMEYSRTHMFVSPILIWYVFWLGIISVGRMDLDLYPFYQTWSEALLKLVLVNTEIFFLFFWVGEAMIREEKVAKNASFDNYRLLPDVVVLLLSVSVFAFVLNTVKIGVIPQLSEDPNSFREVFVQGRYYKVVNLLRFSFALVPAAVRLSGNRRKKILLIALSLTMLLLEMFSGWRTYTLQTMILLLTGYFLTADVKNRSVRNRNFLVVFLFTVAAVVFFGYIAVTRDKVTGALREKFDYLVYTLDMYVAPNFLNLQSAMIHVDPVKIPVYSTQALWTFFADRSEVLGRFGEINQTIGTFNVSTYMLQPWGDYGITGTVMSSAFIALFSGISFRKCRNSNRIFYIVLLGLMNITVFLMHNNLFLRAKSVVAWLLFALIIEAVVKFDKLGRLSE